MPVELIKNPIKVCRIIGENVFSTVVEEDINVPDISPDVYRILTSNAAILIKDCEVMTDKMLVNGQILINVLYSADMEGKPMDSMDISADFSQSIDMPDVRPKMKESVNAVIQHVECSMIHSRKINIKVIMDIVCRAEELYDLELASDVKGVPDIQVLREPYSLNQIVGYSRDKFEVNEELELPQDSVEIQKVLRSDFRANLKEERVSEGKVEISGILGINLLYVGKDESNSIQSREFEIPFTQYIEVPAAERSMSCSTEISLKGYRLEVEENLDGEKKVVSVHADMNAIAKVFKECQEDVVVDAYSPVYAMEYHKDTFGMNEFVGKARSSTVLKESISIRHGDPEIENVCNVSTYPVINEVKIMDDKVLVEGILECTAVYMSSFSGEPMCSIAEQIPFRHFVEVQGARLGMMAMAQCQVEGLSFMPMNSEMIELRIVLNVIAEVIKTVEKRMINGIEQVEGISLDFSKIPAVTICMVQKGETLWSIAKRYNTTVDALVRLNNIDNPSKVAPGMQILILKSVRIG